MCPPLIYHRTTSGCAIPAGSSAGLACASPAGVRQRETVATGCIMLFTTYSPSDSPYPVPTRVENR